MKYKILTGVCLAASIAGTPVRAGQLNIAFAIHSATGNTFWQAVKLGFDDACKQVNAKCQMIFTQTEGSIQEQVANLQTAIARRPEAIITTIVDDKAYNAVIKDARDKGITVIATNVDHSKGAEGNAREAFVGQDFVSAGYALASGLATKFPAEGPLKFVVGVNLPGANFSERRALGILNFLNQYKTDHPDQNIEIRKIDASIDPAVTAERFGSLLSGDPGLTAYFDTVNNDAAVARVLKDRGIAPGKVLLAGFDLIPQVIQELQSGYIQVQCDQQPYMQGYMPVVLAYLKKDFGLAPVDINTGKALVTAADAPALMALSKKGIR